MYNQGYALDYCGNLADLVASGILVSCWRSPDSPYFGNRRDRGGNQARHRSRGVAFDCALGKPIPGASVIWRTTIAVRQS
jgi:hypothetical protein